MGKTFRFVVLALLLLALGAGAAWAQAVDGQGQTNPMRRGQQRHPYGPYGYGPGMMMGGYGYGPGMMMAGWGYGPGMMGWGHGPGMMGGYGYGPGMMMGGYGYGPGMMWGHMRHHRRCGLGFMGRGLKLGHGWGMGWALNYLNLTSQQRDKVNKLTYERLEKLNQLRAKLGAQRIELLFMLRSDKVDAAKIKALFAKMADLRSDMLLTRIKFLQDVKALLTKDQLQKLER